MATPDEEEHVQRHLSTEEESKYMTMRTTVVILLTLLVLACKDEVTPPPPPHVSTVQLTVEDVAVTEVWLRLKFTDAAQPRSYALRRDNVLIATGTLTGADTLLADTTTSPGHTYSYKGLRLTGTVPTDSSSALQVTTLDTTSHVFSQVRIDTLGDGDASALYDVAIINDTTVYAVGEMYFRDSVGNWESDAYNAAKWSGTRWELLRIPFVGPCSAVRYPPIRAIWAFSESNILLTNGGSIVRYDGINATMDCRMNSLLAGAITKMYAVAPQDIYAVGNAGTIVHYASGAWTHLESGTQVSINDIWGVVDQATGKRTILCAATNVLQGGEHKLLTINETGTVDSVAWISQKELRSVWFQTSRRVLTAGEGLFIRRPDKVWSEFLQTPRISTNSIRGAMPNDVFAVGGFGLVLHFNGIAWHEYPEAAAALVFASVDYKSNLVVAVGYTSTRAIVVQMRR